ncbi:MAG TPA: hypothetical protein VHF25_05050 [Nitriliruptorales bacterium]|nr:hypothetical protein [Nitriliruptorales bacterium]
MEQDQDLGASPEIMDQLDAVLKTINRPALRRSFLSDPERILKEQGVDLEVFPRELIDVLADMSYDELSVVARLYDEGCEHRLVIGRTSMGGTVCLF